MSYRKRLPQEGGDLFVTDGGMETVLIFKQGFDLPLFASFTLLAEPAGAAAIRAYYEPYVEIAAEHEVGLVLDAATWRASRDWGTELGYSTAALADANRRAVEIVEDVRTANAGRGIAIVVSAALGPRGDGYNPSDFMSAGEAEDYHSAQIETLRETTADMVTSLTMTYPEEAIGIVRAARSADLPIAVSFTVETDGRLPNGQSLAEAIEQVDIETDAATAYFMVNCAHPSHFAHVLEGSDSTLDRIKGIRVNASPRSHAELDNADELDDGDPLELGARCRALVDRTPAINVVGGCCGTDDRHIRAICGALVA